MIPFLKVNNESELSKKPFIDFNVIHYNYKKKQTTNANLKDTEIHKSTVTDLCRYISEKLIYEISEIMETSNLFTKTNTEAVSISIENIIKNDDGKIEDVSEINGIIIPAFFEKKVHKISTIEKIVLSFEDSEFDKRNEIKKKINFDFDTFDITTFTQIGLLYHSITQNLLHKIYQVQSTSWLTLDQVKKCSSILESHLKDYDYDNIVFEKELRVKYESKKYGTIFLNGRMDILIKDTSVFEIKCTTTLLIEHKIQLLLYAWMCFNHYNDFDGYDESLKKIKNFKLLNLKTNELWEMDVTDEKREKINEIVEIIFYNKYGRNLEKSDDCFIQECLDSINRYTKETIPIPKQTPTLKTFNNITFPTIGIKRLREVDDEKTFFPKKENILVFDTEYTGKGQRLIELGWVVFEKNGSVIKKENFLIKPDGFYIDNTFIHGISQDYAEKNGFCINIALDKFIVDLRGTGTIVAHNISSDISVLTKEFSIINNNQFVTMLSQIEQNCTMKIGREKFKLSKNPKLTELYEKLFSKPCDQSHRALQDAEICSECFFKLNGGEDDSFSFSF